MKLVIGEFGIPYLLDEEDDSSVQVEGEIFEVDAEKRLHLDYLEGVGEVGDWYDRLKIPVIRDDNGEEQVRNPSPCPHTASNMSSISILLTTFHLSLRSSTLLHSHRSSMRTFLSVPGEGWASRGESSTPTPRRSTMQSLSTRLANQQKTRTSN